MLREVESEHSKVSSYLLKQMKLSSDFVSFHIFHL